MEWATHAGHGMPCPLQKNHLIFAIYAVIIGHQPIRDAGLPQDPCSRHEMQDKSRR